MVLSVHHSLPVLIAVVEVVFSPPFVCVSVFAHDIPKSDTATDHQT